MSGAVFSNLARSARLAWFTLVDLVYPPACIVCASRHESDAAQPLCPDCRGCLTPIGKDACPRCGQALGPHTSGRKACRTDHRGLVFRQAVAACPYHGVAEHVVKAFKFGRDMRALEIMGPMLAERLANAPFIGGIEVVVPVPLHWRRRAMRRFNQAELLAERVADTLDLDFEPDALKRTRYTIPQALLAPRERASNLRGAFAVRRSEAIRDARVLLVDDVMATCSTARECSVTLRAGGARSTDVAVFAR